MNFKIDTDKVTAELRSIDECIDKLEGILGSMETDVSGGWSSARAKEVVEPKIQEVKDSIKKIRTSTNNVRSNVTQYVSNVRTVDTAGSIKSA